MKHDQRVFLPVGQVIERFVTQSGTPMEELRGPAQTKEISRRRQELMWLLRHLTTSTMAQIGAQVGGRTAATVDEGIDRISMRALNDATYRQFLADLRDAIAMPVAEAAAPRADVRRIMAVGLLADVNLSDADARKGALMVLRADCPPSMTFQRDVGWVDVPPRNPAPGIGE